MSSTLKITVDTSDIEGSIVALDRLTAAANRAAEALRDLGEQPHGGVSLQVVDSVSLLEIKPPAFHVVRAMADINDMEAVKALLSGIADRMRKA